MSDLTCNAGSYYVPCAMTPGSSHIDPHEIVKDALIRKITLSIQNLSRLINIINAKTELFLSQQHVQEMPLVARTWHNYGTMTCNTLQQLAKKTHGNREKHQQKPTQPAQAEELVNSSSASESANEASEPKLGHVRSRSSVSDLASEEATISQDKENLDFCVQDDLRSKNQQSSVGVKRVRRFEAVPPKPSTAHHTQVPQPQLQVKPTRRSTRQPLATR